MPSTDQSIIIDAPISVVWERFSDFHNLTWAPDVITNVKKVGRTNGNEVGAKRVLNDAFHETLIQIDHDHYVLKYSIDDGPSPVSRQEVSNYYGVVKLTPVADGNRTHVSWSSSWESNFVMAFM